MRWLILIGLIVIVPLVGIYGAGKALPEKQTHQAETRIDSPPAILWELISDIESYATWHSAISRVKAEPDDAYTLFLSDGTQLELRAIKRRPPELMRLSASAADGSYTGAWTLEMASLGKRLVGDDPTKRPNTDTTSTLVRLTEERSITSPFMRFWHHYIVADQGMPDTLLTDLVEQLSSASNTAKE